MKRAVSVSLGSSTRDKRVELELGGEKMVVERIGTDGDVDKYRKLFGELDGKVDAFGVGGVDMYLRFEGKEWPLRSVLKILDHVRETPLCDGRGMKHTLEARVMELAKPQFPGGELPHFKRAFIPVAVDRLGLASAISQVTDEVVYGDLMVALGLPLPVYGIKNFRRVVRFLMPMVSYFPLSIIFYGSSGEEPTPKYVKYWEMCDLIAGDFLFMRKYMPESIAGKTIITNTTTAENLELLRERGADMVITTTPRYEGRSFGTNMMEAMLTAYAGKGRNLTDDELNALIDELDLRPTVDIFEP